MAKKPKDFEPYAGRILHSAAFPHCIVAARTFEGCRVVYERPAMPEIGRLGLGVNVLCWHDDNLPGGRWPAISRDENTPLQTALARIKRSMLDHGAVAEAVELIGDISPFKPEELKIMAEKLKAKGGAAAKTTATKAPKKGDAEALKAAAASAPVGGKAKGGKAAAAPAEAPKKRGNPEALAKARAAGNADREARRKLKITLVEKKNPKKPSSGAFHQYEKYKTCKTVGDFLDAGGTSADLNYDSKKGFIKVG